VGDPTAGGPLAQQPNETRLLRRTVAADVRQISGGFEAKIAPFGWLAQWQIAPSYGESWRLTCMDGQCPRALNFLLPEITLEPRLPASIRNSGKTLYPLSP